MRTASRIIFLNLSFCFFLFVCSQIRSGLISLSDARLAAPVGGVRFNSLILHANGRPTTTVRPDDIVTLHAEVMTTRAVDDLVIAYAIRDPARNLINSSNTQVLGVDLGRLDGSVTVTFTFDGLALLNGMYEVDLGAHSVDGTVRYAQVNTAARFTIVGGARHTGIAHLPVQSDLIR